MTANAENVRVFIGFDPREEVAIHVLSRSIWERSSLPVTITPVRLSHLEGVFTRARDPLQSTDFSFTRFLTPWLCNYQGWALFTDCDMLAVYQVNEDGLITRMQAHWDFDELMAQLTG